MPDLWPLTPIEIGNYSPRHPYIRVLQRAEDYAYRKADVVVSVLPHALGHMVARGLDPRKFVHIPNGVPVARAGTAEDGELPGHAYRCHFPIGTDAGARALEQNLAAGETATGLPVKRVGNLVTTGTVTTGSVA